SQCLHQNIGCRAQEKTKLVCKESMATRAIGKEIELLLLDAVFHFAALTVIVLVQVLRFTWDIGHHEAGVRTLSSVFVFDDHLPLTIPLGCCVAERTENPLRFASPSEQPGSSANLVSTKFLKDRVFRQAEDVADAVTVAPAHESPAAESA